MSDDKPDPKIGAGHASAMFRQGLAELRAALYPESNVAQPAQYGLYGTKTPGEVQDEREASARELDDISPSAADARFDEANEVRGDDVPGPLHPERE